MSNFETFTKKGGKYITSKTASLTMNKHGYLNIPGSVRETVFEGADYIEYHADQANNLLAVEGHNEDAPTHAYTLSGDGNGSVPAENVLVWMGKRPPEKHTMFELKHDDESDLPYIDVSKLPDVGDSE